MAQIRWTLQAANDLEAIAEFIAVDSPQYAQLFVLEVLGAIDRLASFPRLGRVVPELGKAAIREIICGNYRIVYRLRKDDIVVLTVYHGARLLNPADLK